MDEGICAWYPRIFLFYSEATQSHCLLASQITISSPFFPFFYVFLHLCLGFLNFQQAEVLFNKKSYLSHKNIPCLLLLYILWTSPYLLTSSPPFICLSVLLRLSLCSGMISPLLQFLVISSCPLKSHFPSFPRWLFSCRDLSTSIFRRACGVETHWYGRIWTCRLARAN